MIVMALLHSYPLSDLALPIPIFDTHARSYIRVRSYAVRYPTATFTPLFYKMYNIVNNNRQNLKLFACAHRSQKPGHQLCR